MIIREVISADCVAMTDIYNYYIEATTITFETVKLEPEDMTKRIRMFLSAGYPCLVAEEDGRVVGYCYAHPWKEKSAYSATLETTVYVAPGQDRRGTGRALMSELIKRCRESGTHALIACVTAENAYSIEFHRRLGFKEVSRFEQVGFKHGRWLDVIDMEMLLKNH